MQNKVIYSLVILLIVSMVTSCNFIAQEADSDQNTEPDDSVQKAQMNIPCFSCHSYEKFKDQQVFPHDMHRSMGLHCNQCHLLISHESLKLNRATCKSCHSDK